MRAIQSISIIIPAFNESLRIAHTLERMISFWKRENINFYEIIVVNDGSLDQTKQVIEEYQEVHSNIRMIDIKHNQGKGYSIQQGIMEAKGEYLLYVDADEATPIEEIYKLENAIILGAHVAIGSRELCDETRLVIDSPFRRFIGKVFNRIVRIFSVTEIRDTQCGFKLFRRHAALTIFSKQRIKGFCFDVEVLYLARKYQFKVVEVPVHWRAIKGSKVRPFIDGPKMFLDIFKIRLYDFLGKY